MMKLFNIYGVLVGIISGESHFITLDENNADKKIYVGKLAWYYGNWTGVDKGDILVSHLNPPKEEEEEFDEIEDDYSVEPSGTDSFKLVKGETYLLK